VNDFEIGTDDFIDSDKSFRPVELSEKHARAARHYATKHNYLYRTGRKRGGVPQA